MTFSSQRLSLKGTKIRWKLLLILTASQLICGYLKVESICPFCPLEMHHFSFKIEVKWIFTDG